MKRVMVSDLKAHLSAYLAAVRGGETILVCDRQTPVARLSPLSTWDDDLVMQPASRPVSDLGLIKAVPLPAGVDVVAILREDRDYR
jgi:prevent-host-death family protein